MGDEMDDPAAKYAETGRRRHKPIRPRWARFHEWLERHPRACAVYAWQYRTRAKLLHRIGRHGPHFMGEHLGMRRCSWCGSAS